MTRNNLFIYRSEVEFSHKINLPKDTVVKYRYFTGRTFAGVRLFDSLLFEIKLNLITKTNLIFTLLIEEKIINSLKSNTILIN